MTKNPSYIDCTVHNNKIYTWIRGFDGKLITRKTPAKDYCYVFIPDNTVEATHKSIYGIPMKKLTFDNRTELRKYAETHDNVHESDIPVNYKYLIDVFSDADAGSPYNLMFFDIEVDYDLEDGHGYPTPSNAFGEINAISTFDCKNERYVMYANESLKGKIRLKDDRHGYPVDIVWCEDESHMLEEFQYGFRHVDILSSWNGENFDIPYIMERVIHNFGENTETLSYFCRNDIPAYKREFKNEFGENVWVWNLYGRVHLDMMEVFKKFKAGERRSFSLEAICQEELGEGKVQFEDDLGGLYRENPQTFFEYSLHDSRLLKMLNDKTQFIQLAVLLSRWACARISDATGSVKLIDQDFIKYCHARGIVVPDAKHNSKESYDGAVVFDTVEGRHEWVIGIDVTSMYPHSIMLLGLSPETMLFQCLGEYDDFVLITTGDDSLGEISIIDMRTKDEFKILPSKALAMIKEQGYTISANGTIFDGSMGLFATYIKEGFDLRKKYQKMKKEAEANGDKANALIYNLYQNVFKLKINSFYGITGNEVFRFYMLEIAKSITLTAQIIAKWQTYHGQKALNLLREE